MNIIKSVFAIIGGWAAYFLTLVIASLLLLFIVWVSQHLPAFLARYLELDADNIFLTVIFFPISANWFACGMTHIAVNKISSMNNTLLFKICIIPIVVFLVTYFILSIYIGDTSWKTLLSVIGVLIGYFACTGLD